MATNDPLLQMLQAQGATGLFDSEGHFQIDKDALRERYASLLENDLDAVLFFVQSAHKWKARSLEIKLLKTQFQARIHLPEQSLVLERLSPSPARVLEAFFPQDHPLFELAQGYNILNCSKLTRRIEVTLEEEFLCVCWDFHSKRSLLFSTRMEISVLLIRRVVTELPLSLDSREQDCGKYHHDYLHSQFSFGEVPVPVPVVACEQNVLEAWDLTADQVEGIEVPESGQAEWMMSSNEEGAPVFLNRTAGGESKVYYFPEVLGRKGATIIPLRYGVPLGAITLDKEFGTAVMFVKVESLRTDLSGLKLVKDEAYHEMIENAKATLHSKLDIIESIEEHYQPKIDRQERFKQALTVSVLTPPTLALGIMLGGVGAILKSAIVLKGLACTFPVGVLSQARTLADPSHYTRSQRQKKFGWLNSGQKKDRPSRV